MMATATAKKEKVSKKRVDATKVKSDDLMAFLYYARVNRIRQNGSELSVTDVDRQSPFDVNGKVLVESAYSADQFHTTKRTTKTKVAEILISSPNRPLTVCFLKATGEERVLRGRLVKPEPLLGRSMVEDLDLTSGNRLRQVDHRTICWLVVDGIKYTVRSK